MIDVNILTLDLLFKVLKIIISLFNIIFCALVLRNLIDRQTNYNSILYLPFLMIIGVLGLFSILFFLSALL